MPTFDEKGEIKEWFGMASDITVQKKAEEEFQRYSDELKRKEKETLELIDSFTEGSWIVDPVAGTIMCSEKWAKCIGLNLVPEEERLAYTHTLIHPDDTTGGNSIPYYIEIGAARFDLEYRIKTVDSGYIWAKHRGKIVYNEKGQAVKVYGVTFDITEHKHMEDALRESEAKYRTIFETSQEGIWVINGNDQTILVNERLQQMLGYSFDELMGRSPQAFMAPEFQAAANERLADHMEGNKQVIDYRFIKKDGSSLWCILSSTPLFDKNGKFDGSIAMFSDITDRKKTEIEKDHYMKIAEERADWLQAIMDLIPAGIWVSDHTGKVVMVNQETVNMYRGSSPLFGSLEEYTSHKLFLPGTDEPVVFKPFQPKEALIGVVLDFERFDGTRGTQVASTEALRDKEGNIINYVVVAMDITPLREAEKALKKSENNALELVDKLNQAKEELTNALHLAEQKSAEWNAIVDAVPDGLTVYGKSGEILYMNDAVKNIIDNYDASISDGVE